jgi:phytoene desaturase
MSVIQHLEKNYGTYVAEKGMFSIAESLFELAKKVGVKFEFETEIDNIIIDSNKKIRGVKSKKKTYNADIVISNMDVYYTFNKLIKNIKKPLKILNQERSSSAVIFYWGVKKTFKDLDLHNIFFSKDYKSEFKSIFKDKNVSEDPTIYINITSKEIPSDAPKGCENWYVMINTPPDYGQDWSKIVKNLRSIVIKKLSIQLEVDLEKMIVSEKIITPRIIQKNSKSYMGALYGTSSNDLFSAFLRHPNFSTRVKNLYFCGGSVHPGGGIPLCLLSAKIVDDLIPKSQNEL